MYEEYDLWCHHDWKGSVSSSDNISSPAALLVFTLRSCFRKNSVTARKRYCERQVVNIIPKKLSSSCGRLNPIYLFHRDRGNRLSWEVHSQESEPLKCRTQSSKAPNSMSRTAMRRLAANLLEVEWRSEVQGRPSRQASEKCLQDSTIRAPTFQIFVVRIFQNFAKCVSKFSAIQSNFTDGGRSFTTYDFV